jgi:hypothetical protein
MLKTDFHFAEKSVRRVVNFGSYADARRFTASHSGCTEERVRAGGTRRDQARTLKYIFRVLDKTEIRLPAKSSSACSSSVDTHVLNVN